MMAKFRQGHPSEGSAKLSHRLGNVGDARIIIGNAERQIVISAYLICSACERTSFDRDRLFGVSRIYVRAP
jgi:hypothetical protein